MDPETVALVHLNRVAGLGPGRIARLLNRFGSATGALASPARAWEEAGIPGELACAALSEEARGAAGVEIERAASAGIRILTCRDPGYPGLYRRIAVPPPVLYMRGDLTSLGEGTTAVAVVGSRTPTGYGRDMAGRIASGLAAVGVVVVSGLARGIDSAAHRGALELGGRTVAVLASGLSRIVASEDSDLPARIEACGALVSEFPLDVRALRGHFPRRNRLLSGLAVGTVVVEAAEKSGSLLTAQWALDQDRCVMAVPGRADNPMAKGSNGLLRRGAALIEGPEDVLREIGFAEPPGEESAAGEPDELLARIGPAGATLDELAEGSGRAPEEFLTDLLRLEIAGLVRLAPGGIYRRNRGLE